ncbi:peptidoglycan DD-metalloendopeptidase family protein [Streptomyces sp. NPDC052396]|uniref:peptidoglycan DD-metalloendopeptidase family protein n=1 Tax=Streptomyces sp. NPDC052396 TaxID=3365689 RepID=UPI0037D41F17
MASNGPVTEGSSSEPASWGEDAAEAGGPAARGRHRVARQRGGTMVRGGAVLGVGVIAAVGAGGVADAQERPSAAISMPDVPEPSEANAPGLAETAPQDTPELTPEDAARAAQDAHDAGEALRARILQQVGFQQASADDSAGPEAKERAAADAERMAAAAEIAAQKAEQAAKSAQEAARAVRETAQEQARRAPGQAAAPSHEQAAAHHREQAAGHPHRTPAEQAAEAARQAAADAEQAGPAGHPAHHAPKHHAPKGSSRHHRATYVLPLTSYTLTAGFGESGHRWAHHHTGQDFAAPTGSPVRAVSGGTVTHAGWAGAYGYRIVLRLHDGTELWFCHLSSMVVTSGKVTTGTVIGRVGATGNATGPHLHLEVRPGGGHPVDPLPWLRAHGLHP